MLEDLLSGVIPQGIKVLNTKKINKNINKLLNNRWFKELYENENYRHLFFSNRKVRSFLESERRVNKIIINSSKREKFISLLKAQLKN